MKMRKKFEFKNVKVKESRNFKRECGIGEERKEFLKEFILIDT